MFKSISIKNLIKKQVFSCFCFPRSNFNLFPLSRYITFHFKKPTYLIYLTTIEFFVTGLLVTGENRERVDKHKLKRY